MNDKELAQIVARNIRRLISRSGKTQKEVAKELGFNPTTFNTWCVGKILPSTGKVQYMADYFGVGKSALYEENETENDFTDFEIHLIKAYRSASAGIKESVEKLLDVQKKGNAEPQQETFSA